MSEMMPHIQLPAGLEIRNAILPGDPGRVDRVAACLEQPEALASTGNTKVCGGCITVFPCW